MGRSLPLGPEVRVSSCAACASPLQAPAGGGEVRCPVCTLAVAVGPLSMDPPGAGGPGRHDHYRRQLRSRQLPYARSEALDAEVGRLLPEDVQAPFVLLSAFQRAAEPFWEAARRRRSGGAYRSGGQGGAPSAEQEQRLSWLAHRAVAIFSSRGEPQRARPLVETAYELSSDRGWRQLALCDLSQLAQEAGDLEAAHGWLVAADPWPDQVEIRSATCLQRARVAAAAQDWTAVLAELGSSHGSMAVVADKQIAIGLLRVAALEGSGAADAADEELEALVEVHLVIDLEAALDGEPLLTPARSSWARLQAEWEAKAARKRRWDLQVAAMLFGAGLLFIPLGALLFWNGTTATLDCEAKGVASECRIVDDLLGSPIGERAVVGLSGARVSSYRSDSSTTWVLWLTTAGEEVKLFECGDCEQELNEQVAKIDRFVSGQSQAITVVEIGENPLPFLGFALGMVGLSFSFMGAWRAFGALFRREHRA